MRVCVCNAVNFIILINFFVERRILHLNKCKVHVINKCMFRLRNFDLCVVTVKNKCVMIMIFYNCKMSLSVAVKMVNHLIPFH